MTTLHSAELELRQETDPIKPRSRVSFPAWGDFGMPDDCVPGKSRIAHHQRFKHSNKGFVLTLRIRQIVSAFQFDADRPGIAVLPTPPHRHTRVPSPSMERNKLDHRTLAVYEEMRTDPHTFKRTECRITVAIERTGEQRFNCAASKLTRWQ